MKILAILAQRSESGKLSLKEHNPRQSDIERTLAAELGRNQTSFVTLGKPGIKSVGRATNLPPAFGLHCDHSGPFVSLRRSDNGMAFVPPRDQRLVRSFATRNRKLADRPKAFVSGKLHVRHRRKLTRR